MCECHLAAIRRIDGQKWSCEGPSGIQKIQFVSPNSCKGCITAAIFIQILPMGNQNHQGELTTVKHWLSWVVTVYSSGQKCECGVSPFCRHRLEDNNRSKDWLISYYSSYNNMDVWAVSAQMIHAETEQLHITVKIEGGTALKKFPLKFYLLLSLGKGSEESN